MSYISTIKDRSGKVYIDDALQMVGPLTQVRPVDEDKISLYQGKVPDILIDFWRNHGLGTLQGGLLRLCIPDEFDGLLSQIFGADSDFSHSDCHVIGHSPFGHLFVWSERHWLVKIDLPLSRMECVGLLYPEQKRIDNSAILAGLFVKYENQLSVLDDAGKPLFARAHKKHGDLAPNECYGFAPALALGGAPEVKNIKKFTALEHFLLLAQLQPVTLIDYQAQPVRSVRQIG